VLAGLQALMDGRTTILITHSQRLAATASRIVDLGAGRVAGVRVTSEPSPPRAAAPSDPVLPLARLLEEGEMRAALARSLGDAGTLDELTVGRVVYKPGKVVTVHYRAVVSGVAHDAVATSEAGGDLAERPRQASWVELARKVNGRAPAPPVAYDDDLGALVMWLPFDPELPVLAESGSTLARCVREATGAELEGEPVMVAYKPAARAVLRAGRHVLKAYGTQRSFDGALGGLVAMARSGPMPTSAFVGAVPDLRLTVQGSVDGHRPGSAAEVASEAGELVAGLQHAPITTDATLAPERRLDAAARKAAVIAAVLPELRPRLEALLERLGRGLPSGLAVVPSHGDFHVDQLLVGAEGIAVIDFDDMCMAPPAVDIATYAADVVRGRSTDLDAVEEVLDGLLAGYGHRPPALGWHLSAAILGRAAHPFHRQVAQWPERVEAMVSAAEASL
jgi:Phosphotransferase enzyme family